MRLLDLGLGMYRCSTGLLANTEARLAGAVHFDVLL